MVGVVGDDDAVGAGHHAGDPQRQLRLEGIDPTLWNSWAQVGPIFVPDDGPLPERTLPGGLRVTVRCDQRRNRFRRQSSVPGPGRISQ